MYDTIRQRLGRPTVRRLRLRALGLAALCVALAVASAPAAETRVAPPQTFKLQEHKLELFGQGVRTVAWIEAYHCALYLPPGHEPPDAADPKPQAIAFRVTALAQDDDPDMPDEWREAMRAEVSDRLLERMRTTYRKLGKGDVIALGYRRGDGTRVWLNGEPVVHTDGPGLMRAVVKMWLGEQPVSDSLRASLLNRPETDEGLIFAPGNDN